MDPLVLKNEQSASFNREDDVSALCWSPKDKNAIFTGSTKGEVRLFDINEQRAKHTIESQGSKIIKIEFDPANENIFAIGQEDCVKIFDV